MPRNQNSCGLSPWEIATLTFAIHHGDQVVTKSVSLPAPVMYAHKLCEHTNVKLFRVFTYITRQYWNTNKSFLVKPRALKNYLAKRTRMLQK